jgi:hypothetical protein
MSRVIRETIETDDTPILNIVNNIIYLIFVLIEILLSFRFVLKLFGADASTQFVALIYNISGIFVAPFEGIFRTGTSPGVQAASVFEPSTIIAIIVIGVATFGIVGLIKLVFGD